MVEGPPAGNQHSHINYNETRASFGERPPTISGMSAIPEIVLTPAPPGGNTYPRPRNILGRLTVENEGVREYGFNDDQFQSPQRPALPEDQDDLFSPMLRSLNQQPAQAASCCCSKNNQSGPADGNRPLAQVQQAGNRSAPVQQADNGFNYSRNNRPYNSGINFNQQGSPVPLSYERFGQPPRTAAQRSSPGPGPQGFNAGGIPNITQGGRGSPQQQASQRYTGAGEQRIPANFTPNHSGSGYMSGPQGSFREPMTPGSNAMYRSLASPSSSAGSPSTCGPPGRAAPTYGAPARAASMCGAPGRVPAMANPNMHRSMPAIYVNQAASARAASPYRAPAQAASPCGAAARAASPAMANPNMQRSLPAAAAASPCGAPAQAASPCGAAARAASPARVNPNMQRSLPAMFGNRSGNVVGTPRRTASQRAASSPCGRAAAPFAAPAQAAAPCGAPYQAASPYAAPAQAAAPCGAPYQAASPYAAPAQAASPCGAPYQAASPYAAPAQAASPCGAPPQEVSRYEVPVQDVFPFSMSGVPNPEERTFVDKLHISLTKLIMRQFHCQKMLQNLFDEDLANEDADKMHFLAKFNTAMKKLKDTNDEEINRFGRYFLNEYENIYESSQGEVKTIVETTTSGPEGVQRERTETVRPAQPAEPQVKVPIPADCAPIGEYVMALLTNYHVDKNAVMQRCPGGSSPRTASEAKRVDVLTLTAKYLEDLRAIVYVKKEEYEAAAFEAEAAAAGPVDEEESELNPAMIRLTRRLMENLYHLDVDLKFILERHTREQREHGNSEELLKKQEAELKAFLEVRQRRIQEIEAEIEARKANPGFEGNVAAGAAAGACPAAAARAAARTNAVAAAEAAAGACPGGGGAGARRRLNFTGVEPMLPTPEDQPRRGNGNSPSPAPCGAGGAQARKRCACNCNEFNANNLVPKKVDRGCTCVCNNALPSVKELEQMELLEEDEMRRCLRRWHVARRDIIATMCCHKN